MTLLETVKSYINHRLSVVAEEIFCEVKRTIRQYEEEDVCLQRHIKEKRTTLEQLLLQPVIKLHRAGWYR